MQKQINGQISQWTLLEQIGKGDAGEVMKVCSSDDSTIAVLKRPSKNSTGGSIVRQAVQIENEGRVLSILDGIQIKQNNFNLATPLLLDEADPITVSTAKYFIISQQADGDSLSDLLNKARATTKVFPRELLLKVIVALFALFENIHQKGVLWNDVKADHIYWNEKTQSIMVIDWGNAVILNDSRSNILWQLDIIDDYKQMIQEFNSIINSTAPDLIWDLGWPQGPLQELDQNAVTLLRKRVEFADNYYNLRIIEYRAKVKLLLDKWDTTDAFHELMVYVNLLEQMGESVDYPQVLEVVKKVLVINAKQKNIKVCKSILKKVKELPEAALGKEWVILDEILSIQEITRHISFSSVMEIACQQKWVNLFWEVGRIATEKGLESWWNRLSHRIRSLEVPVEFCKSFLIDLLVDMRNDLHIKTIQSRIVDESNLELNELRDLSRILSDLISRWEDDENSNFFGEHLIILRECLPRIDKLGVTVNPLIRSYLLNLQHTTRQIITAWNSADFKLVRQNLMLYFLWDPQFKSSPSLYTSMVKMEQWVKCAYAGPRFPKNGFAFITEMMDSLQNLEEKLGTPAWLQEITECFIEILENKTKLNMHVIQKKYDLPFNWLNDAGIMSQGLDPSIKLNPLSEPQKEVLEAFYTDIKRSVNCQGSIDLLKSELPQFSSAYETLADAFDSQLFVTEQHISLLDSALIPAEDEINFKAAKQVLVNLTNWMKAICEGSIDSAITLLPVESDWAIINTCRKVQIKWQDEISPLLSDIKQKCWDQKPCPEKKADDQVDYLKYCLNSLYQANQIWLSILEIGLNPRNIIDLSETFEKALQSYYTFMNPLEGLKEMKLLFSCFGNEINALYRQIHQILDQAKTLQVALEVLSRDEMIQTRIAYNCASDLMHALIKLDEFMPDNEGDNQVSDWVKTYQQVLDPIRTNVSEHSLSEIDQKHPLITWFHGFLRTYQE